MKYRLFISGLLAATGFLQAESGPLETDLLIVGATESGWAAAIQAARMGVKRVTIVHDGEWFGGQFTEQALACVDEDKGVGKVGWGVDWHPMKRSFHRSGLFKELMDKIEAHNTAKYGSPMPGRPWHGPSTFRPAEAEAIFREMIQPYIDSGQIQVFWNWYPADATVEKNRLAQVEFLPLDENEGTLLVRPKLTIDASDWGEVIQVSGAAYEVGPDPKSRYNEPSATEEIVPNEMNPITWAMIVEESPTGEPTPIPEPPNFDDRNYPRATHFSRTEFANLKWDRKTGLGAISHWPDGGAENSSPRQLSVFSVRRIVDGYSSKDGKTSILLNYMNGQDYPLTRLPTRVANTLEKTEPGASQKNIVEMTREQREIVFQDAKHHAKGVLYHLQNFVHERAPDKTNSFRNFRLSREFGTDDNLPPKPYIRESLRLKAMYMMREQDGRNRDGETKKAAKERFSHVMYADGLFAWQFHYDFHRTGRTYLETEGENGPWIDYETPGRHTRHVSDRCVFPARSLVPIEMDGLLGAQGNVGFSSIVSAAIRLHDQRIHIGQASGAMAAVSLAENVQPRKIPYDADLLEAVRAGLCGEEMEGVPLLLYPFRDLKPEDECFVAVNRMAIAGALEIDPRKVDFEPKAKDRMENWEKKHFAGVKPETDLRVPDMSRGDLARFFWELTGKSATFPPRKSPTDADGDGIPDIDDALLFKPNDPIEWKIEKPKLTAQNDGLVDNSVPEEGRWFDFAGPGVPEAEGFERDSGAKWDDTGGFGWKRDISKNARRRNVYPEIQRDAFLFTREADTWECWAGKGMYRVTVCVGDSGHDQVGQNVTIEGKPVIQNVSTVAGQFHESTIDVEVTDGYLTVEIGKPEGGSNTCLNWLTFLRTKKLK
ncbi:MAG: FAD-dependent oxidoreductase [Verrucomicrobiales bacterium]|nr:FAD-dependent oxidoreductase [Verrucomicrobiales bacterium]